jgi:hypothetical protein
VRAVTVSVFPVVLAALDEIPAPVRIDVQVRVVRIDSRVNDPGGTAGPSLRPSDTSDSPRYRLATRCRILLIARARGMRGFGSTPTRCRPARKWYRRDPVELYV